MRDPVLAGILSLIIPGAGQIYNGRVVSGILWFLCAVLFWGWTFGFFGWIFHILAAYTAYSYAKEHRIRI